MRTLGLTVAALPLSGTLAPAVSQTADTDQPSATDIEIQFWNAAKHGPGVAGYRSYLMLFPDGKFARLARLRAGDRTAPPDPSSAYRLTALPYVAGNGTPTHIVCTGFGEPALFDYLVVVASGTPDFDPATDNSQSLYTTLPHIQPCEGAGALLPVMPPGSYEARYLSRSSTSDGSLQVLARVGFLSQ
jgi:hypothetical protein